MTRFLMTAGIAALLAPGAALAASHADAPPFPCINVPTMSPDMPGDTVLSDQPSFNCFAWSEFIAMNWGTGPDASAETFGMPFDLGPVVFETYKNIHDLMLPDGAAPGPWADARQSRAVGDYGGMRHFSRAAKLEYNYIVENKFYNSEEQYKAVTAGTKVELPMGTVGGPPGAVEFKAAWLSVPDPENAEKWSRYKLSEGLFCTGLGTPDEVCDVGIIALIGLHIIHKTTSQPSWTWATFDHVDNVPDAGSDAIAEQDWNFFSPVCEPRPVPAGCMTVSMPPPTSMMNLAPSMR